MEIIDLANFVEGGLLREEDFRLQVENYDWNALQNKVVLIRGCGEIIIPPWAYMLIVGQLSGIAKTVRFGNEHSNLVVYRRKKAPVSESDSGD